MKRLRNIRRYIGRHIYALTGWQWAHLWWAKGDWVLEVFKPLPPDEAAALREFLDD